MDNHTEVMRQALQTIPQRAAEIAEELRRALPPNTDFADGWQQRYFERQNDRFEKALEMARREATQSKKGAHPYRQGSNFS